jgi:hypothetical protein
MTLSYHNFPWKCEEQEKLQPAIGGLKYMWQESNSWWQNVKQIISQNHGR